MCEVFIQLSSLSLIIEHYEWISGSLQQEVELDN